MTQDDLAEATGYSAPYLSQLETGKKRWNRDVLETIAHALRTTMAALLSRDPPQPGEPDPWAEWDKLDDEERRRVFAIYRAATVAARR